MASSSSRSSPFANANAEFLLSLSAPPDQSGPRTAPSEAELLIDPLFYSFLSGLTVVLLLVSLSYIIAWLTLTAIRRRQYRKYRQRRQRQEQRQRMMAGRAEPMITEVALPSPAPPPPPFVPSLQPLTSSFPYPLYHAVTKRGTLPSLLAPLSSALSAAAVSSSSSPATSPAAALSRLSLSSPSALPGYLLSMLTPRRKPQATNGPLFSPFRTPLRTPHGGLRAGGLQPSPTPTPSSRAEAPQLSAARQRRPARKQLDLGSSPPATASASLSPSSAAGVPAVRASPLSSLQQDDLDAAQHEHNRGFLSFSLSTFLLTVALLWLALIPMTLALTTPRLCSHYLLSWLTPPLVSSLWSLTTTLSSLSVFLVAPFAYLYYEAEGLFFFPLPTFVTSTRQSIDEDETYSFGARFMETAIVLLCSSVMLYGSVHLLHAMVWGVPLLGWSWQALGEWMMGAASLRLAWLFSPSLLSNVMHFFPGLLICLVQSHTGFSSLLSAFFSLRVPFYYRHYLRHQLDTVQVKLIHSRHLLATASSASGTRRLMLCKRVQLLEQHASELNHELHPPLWSLSAFPVLRNGLWLVLTLLCLLLTWHVVVRVMQREARLMMVSLEAMIVEGEEDGRARGIATTLLALLVAVMRWTLRIMKHAVNELLATVGMIRKRDAERWDSLITPSSSSVSVLSLSFVLHLWSDLLRLLSSFLLGQNGFKHPVSMLLFDLLVVNFFQCACVIGLYRMGMMQTFTPFSSFASTARAAFDLGGRNHGDRMVVSDNSAAAQQETGPARGDTSSAAAPATPAAATSLASSAAFSSSFVPSALYSAQFFVVNTAVFLLLASSFPFAIWILGLSSFDLPHFYPAAEELTTGLFMHAYNLAFLALAAGQGASLWSRVTWYFVNTAYASSYAALTYLLPSLSSSLPSPDVVSSLPTRVRAHPVVTRLSSALSWSGMYRLSRAVLVPLLRVMWFVSLLVLRFLAFALRLCAKGVYVKVAGLRQQELSGTPATAVGSDASEESKDELELQTDMSKLMSVIPQDEHKAASSVDASRREAPGDSARFLSSQSSPSLPLLPPSRSATPLRSISSIQPARLIAPRPFSLAAAISLDALNAVTPPDDAQPAPRQSSSTSSSSSVTPRVSHSPSASQSPLSSVPSPFVSRSNSSASAPVSLSSRFLDNTNSYPPRRPTTRGRKDKQLDRGSDAILVVQKDGDLEDGHKVQEMHVVEVDKAVRVEPDAAVPSVAVADTEHPADAQ